MSPLAYGWATTAHGRRGQLTAAAGLALVMDSPRGRAWAYPCRDELTGAMTLPFVFSDAFGEAVAIVPREYHEELAAWCARA